MTQPNLVVITCHDLGDYLGCYGTPVATPNVDSIAAQGVLFHHHCSVDAVCSPARGTLWTGTYPHTNGLMGLVHRGWLPNVEKYRHLAAQLRDNGYHTAVIGVQHEHYDAHQLGYSEVVKIKGSYCNEVAPAAAQWLRERSGSGQPFQLSIGFSDTHRMGMNPSHFRRDAYTPADPANVEVRPALPDAPEVRRELADFYGAVECTDRAVGEILHALDETSLSDNTLLVFTTDHGASFMHGKGTMYEGGTKVAMLMRWPGVLVPGLEIEALTSHVDFVPTVLELLNFEAPDYLQGQSFANLARRECATERRYVFGERNYTNFFDPARMVKSHEYKYIRKGLRTCIFDYVIPELELCPTCLHNPDILNFYSLQRDTEKLFHLPSDPGELLNVIDDPAHATVLADLRQALEEHLEATDDPFRFFRNDLLATPDAYVELKEKA